MQTYVFREPSEIIFYNTIIKRTHSKHTPQNILDSPIIIIDHHRPLSAAVTTQYTFFILLDEFCLLDDFDVFFFGKYYFV